MKGVRTAPSMRSLFSSCNILVFSPWLVVISWGPFQRWSKFLCFPLSSYLASHFKTRSPCWKSSGLVLLSKIFFILSWKTWTLSGTPSLICFTSTNSFILPYIGLDSTSWSCRNFLIGVPREAGKLHHFHTSVEKETSQYIFYYSLCLPIKQTLAWNARPSCCPAIIF